MEQTLSIIARLFNEKNVKWAVGGSLMLKFYGLVNHANDIDIIVSEDDFFIVDKILTNIGQKVVVENNKKYGTKYFGRYVVNNIEIDIIGEFVIFHDEGRYKLVFNDDSIGACDNKSNVNIYYCTLEDWYVLYQLMGRDKKAQIIEDYLTNNIINTTIINRVMKSQIPISLKTYISSTLKF